MTHDEIVAYWIETVEHDFNAMQGIFASGHYVWSLFVGHLVIEKPLKACCVRVVGREVPRHHDLRLLARIAKLEPDKEQQKDLDRLTLFNLRVRYPDRKRDFYRVATKEYAEEWVGKVKELRRWLLQILSPQSNQP